MKTCRSVGRVLRRCGSEVDLILKPRKMSVREASLIFEHTTQLHSLSSLVSLLRHWTVRQLDLTELSISALDLTQLLKHDGPLKIKLSEESVQQLLALLHEIQDQDLTRSFLSKVGGDLTSCSLNWEVLQYLLQQASAQTITVNLRKNCFLQESITRLLPFPDRIVFKRPSPSFVLTTIREIYKAPTRHIIPSLLSSLDHVINLTCRELDSVTNPGWNKNVDRNLLLRLIHCCAASDAQQGAASDLLRALQHRLDLSCSSCVELSEEDQTEPLSLTFADCRAVSTILRHCSLDTQLDLRDCEVEDSSLDLLLPVPDRVRLRASKAVLLQLVSLVPGSSERDAVRRGVSLCRALGGELDLSHTTLDQSTCAALALMLDFSDGLTELDLSHCQLTDQLLLTLITHLHKVQVLDLSHNKITDAATHRLLQLVSINPSIETVRLFNNNIVDRTPFKEDKRFEIW
ncbi:uncharacterized protein LOC128354609 [Scomber japonicus]|uniref:uncharacterized protein LOC128354609 n=1 Tax=Scomber japonicus TaxID=13676 RepID=UPI0023060E23|nr:uncharacterized protein LOC128354609 [Scomber japonicus]